MASNADEALTRVMAQSDAIDADSVEAQVHDLDEDCVTVIRQTTTHTVSIYTGNAPDDPQHQDRDIDGDINM